MKNLRALAMLSLAACSGAAPEPGDAAPGELVLRARSRKDGAVAEQTLRWDAKKTAVVICDMWDTHNCRSAARRVGEMVPRFNEFLRAARAKGALVIHCPSDVVAFYKDTPQRKLAQDAPPAKSPPEIKPRPYDAACEGPWPFDNTKWGCDDEPPCPIRKPYP